MGGSNKQSTSTQSVQIPQAVMDRYNAANDAASTAAAHPFQQYSTDPSAFVAPMSATQNAGVAATNAAAGQAQPSFAAAQQQLQDAQGLGHGMVDSAQTALLNAKTNANPYNGVAGNYYDSAYQGAQPYNQAATGLAAASAQAVNPTALDSSAINKYLSPYLNTVLGGTAAQLNQDNQKAMSGQTGSAISQGAFGGDRSGIAAATLAGQQQLANAQIYSGILNTGYNNALGAAQQQQGVGLGAAQANRSALAGAGQQLQSIGQQQYGQGTTTGQAQQGLGQQVFGQGLSTSQQEAALGQQDYTMGANTAQEQAGLGAGAQSAALQGAQAQLAAGQVQQQTQQAGDTALYNQFLQQQSYPFQTAQFLANVAEGTGSLSGSTTTTTQPGGFFSDERLKEDIKKIGKTFDGQVIYSFKYKGDPRTQVGLMAQDVEKKNPDAVGESHGYKTVDYGKATEGAADRGHFAGGGAPMLPGLSGADMSALLAAQEQMYAPFSQAGGLYGGQTSGMPRGGSSYVPQGNLPVSHLTVAGGLAPQKSGMESAKEIADTASRAAPYVQKGEDWLKDKWAARNDNTMSANENDLSTGGLVPAKRYASGGMPYDAQTGLDIPDETPTSKLQTAGELGKTSSGMDNTKDAVGTALAIAKLAAMFNRGGRAGFADGGSPQFDDTTDFATSSDGGGTPWYLKPVPSPEATGHAIMQGLRGASDKFFAGQGHGAGFADTATTHAGLFGPQQDDAPEPYVGTPVGPIKTAAPSGVSAGRRVSGGNGLSPAVAATDAELPTITASAPATPGGGLAPSPGANQDIVNSVPARAATPDNPGIVSRIASSLGDNVKDYASGLKHGDAQNWLPLISAIAAAGTAPTVHPGVALAAGLGAGAQSYMGTKAKLAEVAKTQAETGQIGEQAGLISVNSLSKLNEMAALQGMVIQENPSGKYVVNGKHYATVPKGTLISGSSVGTPSVAVPSNPDIGPAGQQVAHSSYLTFPTLPDNVRADAQKQIGDTIAQGSAVQQQMPAMREWGASLSQLKDGPLQPGAFSEFARNAANVFNSTVDLLPISDDVKQHLKFDPRGLSASMIANKMQTSIAQARAAGVDQNTLGALERNLAATANEHLTREAALTLWAQEAVQLQQKADLANYMADVDSEAQKVTGQARNFAPADATQAFWKDHPSGSYDADRTRLARMAAQPQFTTWLNLLQSGDPRKASQTAAKIDEIFGPGMSRYLTGAAR